MTPSPRRTAVLPYCPRRIQKNDRAFGIRNQIDAGTSTHKGQFRFRAAPGNAVSYSGLAFHAPQPADRCALLTHAAAQATILVPVL
jgi:hypothetical protein